MRIYKSNNLIDIDISHDTQYYKFLLKLSVIHNKSGHKNWFQSLKLLSEMKEFEENVNSFNQRRLLNKGFDSLIKNCRNSKRREYDVSEMKKTIPKFLSF